MTALLKSLFAALLVTAGTSAFAQTATDSNGLSVGTPAQPAPYVKDTYGDWQLRCLDTGAETDPCQLYQLLMDADGNQVAEVSIFSLPAGGRAALGANIVAPLETLLTQGIVISVGESEPRRFTFTFCNPGGCVARVGFTQEEVDQFKSGSVAKVTLVPLSNPNAPVVLDMSLAGFTAGVDAIPPAPAANN